MDILHEAWTIKYEYAGMSNKVSEFGKTLKFRS